MSKVIRNGVNLTSLSNKQLRNITESCFKAGIDKEYFDANIDEIKTIQGCRIDVAMACLAIDMLCSLKTVTHFIAPSEESKLWSGMEGGHRHHERPKIDVI